MRIFIAGSGKEYAIENFYSTYLSDAGAEVYHFPALKLFSDYYYKNVLNKLMFKSKLSGIYNSINRSIRIAIDEFQPDVVWIFKGMEIFPSTLEWIKKEKGLKLINYNPDNPFIFSGRGSGNKNITASIPLYDFHFTYNLAVKKEIEERYKLPTGFLPFGFDINDDEFDSCAKEDEILKTCFLGNPDIQRARFIVELAKQGITLDVYGNNWTKYVRNENVTIYPAVNYGLEFWKILRKYRVQLNLMRLHNLDSHNMRSFEIPGIGGIMLAPDTTEHRMFFENEKEVFLFSSVETCARQIKNIKAMSIDSINKIRQNARQRCLNSGYTYKDRAYFAFTQIQLLYDPVSILTHTPRSAIL